MTFADELRQMSLAARETLVQRAITRSDALYKDVKGQLEEAALERGSRGWRMSLQPTQEDVPPLLLLLTAVALREHLQSDGLRVELMRPDPEEEREFPELIVRW